MPVMFAVINRVNVSSGIAEGVILNQHGTATNTRVRVWLRNKYTVAASSSGPYLSKAKSCRRPRVGDEIIFFTSNRWKMPVSDLITPKKWGFLSEWQRGGVMVETDSTAPFSTMFSAEGGIAQTG